MKKIVMFGFVFFCLISFVSAYLNVNQSVISPNLARGNDTLLMSCEGNSSERLGFNYLVYLNGILNVSILNNNPILISDFEVNNSYYFIGGQNDALTNLTSNVDSKEGTYSGSGVAEAGNSFIDMSIWASDFVATDYSMYDGKVGSIFFKINDTSMLKTTTTPSGVYVTLNSDGSKQSSYYLSGSVVANTWIEFSVPFANPNATTNGGVNFSEINRITLNVMNDGGGKNYRVWFDYFSVNDNVSDNVLLNLYNVSNSLTSSNDEFIFSCQACNSSGCTSFFNSSSVVIDSNWVLSNCSVGNLFNITIYDEDSPSNRLNADIEVSLNTSSGVGYSYDLTFSESGSSNYGVCISPSGIFSNVFADLYVQYTAANGFTHRYYLYNQSFTGTINLYLYNFNTTTGVSDLKITARNTESYNYYENVVGKLQRRYVGEGVWRTVQMDKSGDFGSIFYNILEENTDYRIIYSDESNNILKETNSMKFVCTDGVCDLTQLLSEYSTTVASSSIVVSSAYNNETNILQVNWSNSLGLENTVQIRLTKTVGATIVNICAVNQTGASGSYNCNASGYTGEAALEVLTINSPLTPAFLEYIRLTYGALSGLISVGESSFWTAGIMMTIIGFGVVSIIASVVMSIVGLILVYYLGIFKPLVITMIFIAAGIGVIIAVKVRRR